MVIQQESVLIGRIWIIGFGAVAQTLIPMLIKHLSLSPKQIHVLSEQIIGPQQVLPFMWQHIRITEKNYRASLPLQSGDVVFNLATQVCSKDLILWCWQCGAMYLDTCVEPWPGGYEDDDVLKQTNAWLRRDVLSLNQDQPVSSSQPTALVAHGANPGLVSHFLKQALEDLADQRGVSKEQAHATIARELGVKVIHIAERDTQDSSELLQASEFVNTWSVKGLLTELQQPIEMGLGSHEKRRSDFIYPPFEDCSVALDRGLGLKKIRSWVPSVGQQTAWMITHHEAISMAAYLTDDSEQGVYRPSVYYAYRPSPKTAQSINDWLEQEQRWPAVQTILDGTQIKKGFDELGVLIMGEGWGYWYGSHLSIEQVKEMKLPGVNVINASSANATTMQVAAGIMAGLHWMLLNPNRGVVEAESMDSAFVLNRALPYLGNVFGVAVPSALLSEWLTGLALCDFEIV